jgi:hypothetical protein
LTTIKKPGFSKKPGFFGGAPMSHPRRLLRWLQFRLRALLLLVLLIGAALAGWIWYTRDEPPSALLPPGTGPWLLTSERSGKVEAELRKPTKLEFSQVALPDAMEYLGNLHGINIRIDEQALQAAKLDLLAVALTAKLEGVTLDEALGRLLHSKGLIWMVEDDTLVITTVAATSNYQITYVYSLAELPRKDAVRRLLAEALERQAVQASTAGAQGKQAVSSSATRKPPAPSLDQRLRLIGGALILRGTAPEHALVRKTLAELRSQSQADPP